LPEGSVCAVHWLREKAITAGVTVESIAGSSEFRTLFPWGVFLNTLPESLALDRDGMMGLLTRLRNYTTAELGSLGLHVSESGDLDFRRVLEFVGDGLRNSLPLGKFSLVNSESAARVLAVCLSGVAALQNHPVIAALGPFAPDALKIAIPAHWFQGATNQIHQTIRKLRYPQSGFRWFREHEEAIESFCEAKGWMKAIALPGASLGV